MKTTYIFKLNALLRPDDAKRVRDALQRQLEEGILVLDHTASFVGRTIEICGHVVEIEFVGDDGKVEHLCRAAKKNADGTCNGYQRGKHDDEPADMCKSCTDNEFYEE